MRINVYSQELDLSRPAELVEKHGFNDEGKAETFYGVRFFLISPEVIHQSAVDDDQSAITFWLPRSGDKRSRLIGQFNIMARLVADARHE